jgi:phosphatidylserine/phosphatidylglycerophosphate/cardiolipin synthase-like enzyme
MKRILFIFCFVSFLFVSNSFFIQAQKIKVYFNYPVNISVSSGANAIYLNQAMDDTLIAYINRAHYSIDVAVYNYIQSGNMSNIAIAINNAYLNGINIRWIYNGSSSNSGLSLLNNGIHTLASPTGSAYNIMHNKFMIIDANSTNPDDPIVWTGSCNWDEEQFNSDVNNVIIFQDSSLAHTFTTEFNEMWGSTGLVPNVSLSKFGPFKTDNTQHIFNIGGTTVEQYFSPSDSTNTHILDAISSANDDLYFGVYTFTEIAEADSIVSKIKNQSVYTAGILDQYSQSFTPYSILSPVMTNMLKIYNQSNSIYHNKMMIADPCSPNSDPLVETGSRNWTISANTTNDENTVIVHDDTITNIYYQSFYQNFLDLGGTLTPCVNSTSVKELNNLPVKIYPNPANESLTIFVNGIMQSQITISNSLGVELGGWKLKAGENKIDTHVFPQGIYFLRMSNDNHIYNSKLIIAH